MLFSVCVAVSLTNTLFAVGVLCMPLPYAGPHIANGWGQPVRLRHLYAARHGLHLQINKDGKVDGSVLQSSYSLLEIRPVDTGFVAIKGVTSSQFLCMDESGKVHGSHTYVKDDCSFLERILPDGYNIYVSDKHGAVVSLSTDRQRLQVRDRGLPPLSQFLPMMSTLSAGPTDEHLEGMPTDVQQESQSALTMDSMDPFGKLSQIVMQSPSFNKR
ncbi:hypothetical protein MATL_G00098250 [Megalops atlanticus]|uniref:Fibroblast growth factor n=1 Tax=Megalops atlanticus TaxID=7932 RepID=A0A9D3Q199_MEGAT|nr:hypothetical protein MATL_G00098250 [Megalops atlanticus]